MYRRMCDRAYIYSARVTSQEWRDTVVHDVVAKLLAGPQISREALLTSLLKSLNQQEPELLEEVQKRLPSIL